MSNASNNSFFYLDSLSNWKQGKMENPMVKETAQNILGPGDKAVNKLDNISVEMMLPF